VTDRAKANAASFRNKMMMSMDFTVLARLITAVHKMFTRTACILLSSSIAFACGFLILLVRCRPCLNKAITPSNLIQMHRGKYIYKRLLMGIAGFSGYS
jgi:hypothetical protein